MSQEAIAEGWRELEQTVVRARAALDRVRSQPVHSPQQRRELHQDAVSGLLGRDMQELAWHVEAGRTTWSEAFEGYSSYSALLTGHLDRMSERYAEQLREAIEADPDFDPWAADPGV